MGCAISTIKYILFIFNVFLTLCGLLLIVIGVLTNSKANSFKEIMAGNLSVPSMLFIGVGVVIFVIAFFGCCGAIQESHCMMTTYAILLLTLIFVEVGIFGVTFFYRSHAQEYLATAVDHVFDQYETSEDARKAVDAIQYDLHCCGTNGPSSWVGKIPASCCGEINKIGRTYSACSGEVWTVGCVDRLTELAREQLSRLAYIAMVVALVEVVGIIFSLCLARTIRRSCGDYA